MYAVLMYTRVTVVPYQEQLHAVLQLTMVEVRTTASSVVHL